MPVGLNLLETVEMKLLEAGLLPGDRSALRRVIDFAHGAFSLRWNSAESEHHTIEIRLDQQGAQRKGDKPMVTWAVRVDETESLSREGRVLLNSKARTVALGETIAAACRDLLDSLPEPAAVVKPDSSPASTGVDESFLSGPAD